MRIFCKCDCEYLDHGITGERWLRDEVRDIPDDETIRLKRNGEVKFVKHVDLLFENYAFKDAATGKNPEYQCSDCGEETTIDYYRHPKSGQMVFNHFDGKRFCGNCYNARGARGKLIIHPSTLEFLST